MLIIFKGNKQFLIEIFRIRTISKNNNFDTGEDLEFHR